jgi:small-conductance mechanosensitive channel
MSAELRFSRTLCSILLCCQAAWPQLVAQPASQPSSAGNSSQAQVEVNGKTIFVVQGILSFPAQARAAAISRRIEGLSKDITFKPDSISVADSEGNSDIMAGDLIVMSVTDQDAKPSGESRQAVAREDAQRIVNALTALRKEYSLKSLILGGVYAIVFTAALFLLLRLLGVIFRKLYLKLDSWRGTRIPSLRIQQFELMPADRIADLAMGFAKLLRLAIVLLALYVYASLVLDLFPWTRGYAQLLIGYVLSPLRLVRDTAVAYLPNVFLIAVIIFIAFYVIKAVRIFFSEIGKETIKVSNFYSEWAEPTYKIVRLMIVLLTVVVIFPYLPGSSSPAFKGVSIFLGALISLGSTSAVADVVAGVILTYMRAFKIGDRVKIAETVGDVIEKTLLVTRVRTIKNVEITITNALVLNSHIINFSASVHEGEGLILHTSVTIGYDAPWRRVHQLLIDAALACEDISREPKPFVFQTALDDFYVHYEVNAFTDHPHRMAKTYSDLHEKIQDKFNEAGVEIMSSHYSNVRDGNRTTIPDAYLPKDYVAPSFRIGLNKIADSLKGRTPSSDG